MRGIAHVEVREPKQEGKRVLRVYEGFGKAVTDFWSLFMGDPQQDRNIVDLFRSNGFSILEGGEFNPDNPLEFGIADDSHSSTYDRDREVARKVGIDMPRSYSPEEALSLPDSLVVKMLNANRGEYKYLLETPDQKIRFIAWALLHQQLAELHYQTNSNEIVQRIFKKVSGRDFADPFIEGRGFLDNWVFEEYINPPGEYNTSFRIVADALGSVYYAQIARSNEKKDSRQMPIPRLQYPPLKEVSRPGSFLTLLLSHPDSPFYIAPKRFTSNIAQGGKPLLLNGRPVKEQADREILEDLGVNPDTPKPPKGIIDTSVAIGRKYRRFYPIVGVDYMMRGDNRRFVLLEVNKGPTLRPEALGLPVNTEPNQCELEVMRRMIAKIPKNTSVS